MKILDIKSHRITHAGLVVWLLEYDKGDPYHVVWSPRPYIIDGKSYSACMTAREDPGFNAWFHAEFYATEREVDKEIARYRKIRVIERFISPYHMKTPLLRAVRNGTAKKRYA